MCQLCRPETKIKIGLVCQKLHFSGDLKSCIKVQLSFSGFVNLRQKRQEHLRGDVVYWKTK